MGVVRILQLIFVFFCGKLNSIDNEPCFPIFSGIGNFLAFNCINNNTIGIFCCSHKHCIHGSLHLIVYNQVKPF